MCYGGGWLAPTGRHKRNLKRAAALGQTQTTLPIQFMSEIDISSSFLIFIPSLFFHLLK